MQVGNRPEGAETSGREGSRQPGHEDGGPLLSWRAAVVTIAIGLVVLLGGGTLIVRQLRATESQQPVAAPTTPVVPAPTPGPTAAPTVLSTATTAPNSSVPNIVPTAVSTTSAQLPVATAPKPLPTATVFAASNDQQLEDEVAAAYLKYWDVTALALWNLDPTHLDDVSMGEELAALRRDIDQLRQEGRAIKSEVQHQYAVLGISGDEADVRDRLRDFSTYVDPVTKQPLPGQARPQDVPVDATVYHLRKVDGIWKVAKGDPDANN